MSGGTADPRLRVLAASQLLDTEAEPAFDRFTRLVAAMLRVPVALVSLVDVDRQFFKSAIGLAPPWDVRRATPLSHSFCQYVTRDREPLVVADAREHPVLRDNLAIPELGVVAYAGIPLIVQDQPIGALCAIDSVPHAWTDAEISTLQDLADAAISEIELRLALRTAQSQRALIGALIESVGHGVLAVDRDAQFLIVNEAAREMFPAATIGDTLGSAWSRMYRSQRESGDAMTAGESALGRGLRGLATTDLTFTLQTDLLKPPIWVSSTGRAMRDADGAQIGAVAVFHDVTERKRQSDLYSTLASNIPRSLILLYGQDLRCIAMDGGLARELGSLQRDPVGKTLRELASSAADPRALDALDAIHSAALAGEVRTLDLPYRDRVLSVHAAPVRDALGRISMGISLAVDVTEQRRTELALRQRDQIYRAIVGHLPHGAILVLDRELRYVTADGPVVTDILRRANVSDLIGRRALDLVADAYRPEVEQMYATVLDGNVFRSEMERAGEFYDVTGVPIFEGDQVSHILLSLYDVTKRKAEIAELKAARATLEQHARDLQAVSVTDELTGLLNRRGFLLVADPDLKGAARTKQKRVLLFLDLNGMKTINDTLGHKIGDLALVETAALLRRVFRSSDVIARLGGDEFVVLAGGHDVDVHRVLIHRVDQAVAAFNLGSAPFRLSISVGIAIYDGANPAPLEQLITEADAQMYEQKRAARTARV